MHGISKKAGAVFLAAILCLTLCMPGAFAASITITVQPKGVKVEAGERATFTVEAQGSDLSYQWQKRVRGTGEYVDIDGATWSSYTTPKTAFEDTHTRFQCVITDDSGASVTSKSANMLVKGEAIRITQQPAARKVDVGDTATFTVSAEGASLEYQWQSRPKGGSSFSDIEGATGASYTTDTLGASDSHTRYRCVISSGEIQVISSSVNLVVRAEGSGGTSSGSIRITKQPEAQKAKNGATATFAVTATGEGLKYQWQKRLKNATEFTDISGANSASYTTDALEAIDSHTRFRCVVTNGSGDKVTSASVNLMVIGPDPTPTPAPTPTPTPVPSGSITVTSDLSMYIGDNVGTAGREITAVLSPSTLSNKDVIWRISGDSAYKYKLVSAATGGTDVIQGDIVANLTVYLVPTTYITQSDSVTVQVSSPALEQSATCNVRINVTGTHTVTFKAPDASTYYQDQVVSANHNTVVTFPTQPVRTGYFFDGWYTGTSGTGVKLDTTTLITSDMVVYANWRYYSSDGQYRIYLYTNDGTSAVNMLGYNYGTSMTLPEPTRPGYIFYGWYTTNSLSGSRVYSISPTDSGDKYFYAQWVSSGGYYPGTGSGGITLDTYSVSSQYGGYINATFNTGYGNQLLTISISPPNANYETNVQLDSNGHGTMSIWVWAGAARGTYTINASTYTGGVITQSFTVY